MVAVMVVVITSLLGSTGGFAADSTNVFRVSAGTNFPTRVAPGTSGVRVLDIVLDATESAEDVDVPIVFLSYSADQLAVYSAALFDGTNQFGVRQSSISPNATYAFSGRIVVGGGTRKTLTLYCDVLSGLTNGTTFRWNIQSVVAIGRSSFNEIHPDLTNNRGPTMTVSSAQDGDLVVMVDPLVGSRILTPGSVGNTVLGIRFVNVGATEDLKVFDLPVALLTSNVTCAVVQNCELFDGGTFVSYGTPPCSGPATEFSFQPITVPVGETKTLLVRCDVIPSNFGINPYGSFRLEVVGEERAPFTVVGASSNQRIRPRIISGQGPLISIVPPGWSRLTEIRTFILPFPFSPGTRAVYLAGTGVSGVSYEIEISQDLRLWRWLGPVVARNDGSLGTLFLLAADSHRFFRLRSVPSVGQ